MVHMIYDIYMVTKCGVCVCCVCALNAGITLVCHERTPIAHSRNVPEVLELSQASLDPKIYMPGL